MAFYGLNFMFRDRPSEDYGLKIYNFGSGVEDSSLGLNIKIIEDNIRRRYKPYFYGVQLDSPLEFEITFGSEKCLSAYDREAIGQWLFGQQNYNYLYIQQSDLESIGFRVILNNPKVKYIGNLSYAFTCTARCESPFASTDEFSYAYTISNTQTITFNNLSNYNGYLKPTLIYTLSSTTTAFSITNQSDNNRIVSFSGLTGGETLTIDCDLEIITSSLGLNRLGKSNYNFLRLTPSLNTLSVTGSGTMIIKCKFPMIVGG